MGKSRWSSPEGKGGTLPVVLLIGKCILSRPNLGNAGDVCVCLRAFPRVQCSQAILFSGSGPIAVIYLLLQSVCTEHWGPAHPYESLHCVMSK